MTRKNAFNIILACIILISNLNFANSAYPKPKKNKFSYTNIAPIITASGNQIYCPLTSIKIVTDVSITDPDDTSTEAVYIQISSGYVTGQDQLKLANLSSHPTIVAVWNSNEGKLKLSSPIPGTSVSYSDFIAAIKDVEFSNSNPSPANSRNFSISIGQANFLPRNGHYYQYFSSPGISWTAAKTAAENSTYLGLRGYLATITAADEAQLAGAQATGNGWIGGSDAETEGVWKWVTGPENGTVFWNGGVNGSSPTYANWNNGEPNNSNNNEHYAHVKSPTVPGTPGSWNDLRLNGDATGDYQSKGYIVEYGGMPGDPILQNSASTSITIPRITGTTSASRCGSGSVTLQATASDGIIKWYETPTSTTSLATGNTFSTLSIGTTTTYYVEAGCISNRIAVNATIKPLPAITSTTATSVCNSGTATLGATASAGTINWYNSSGNLLSTGNSFTTPSISTTTTYYVDATADGCTSLSRTAVIATVTNTPTVSSTSPSSVCGSGTVTLKATASSGNINWYDKPIGGTSLSTSNSFTTPSINATTTYYAEAISNGCKSSRTPVIATVYPIDTVTEEVVLCQGENITLDGSISGMNYLWSPGGETTQTISVSTIGNYSVTISSPTVVSCESKKDISVIEHPQPIFSSILVNENSIKIELVTNQDYYEYSINGIDFQFSNQFTYIPSGQHTAFVKDKNGCNLVTQDFTVFTISKFFTPNGDGFNDIWEIKEIRDYPDASAKIFDRYGKLIINLTPLKYSWDGKFNGQDLPADDYWYRLQLDNSKPEVTGHFTLKR